MSSERDVPGPANASIETSGKAARNVAIRDDRIDSRALFGPSRQIAIEHGADTYILRITAQNKLILTK